MYLNKCSSLFKITIKIADEFGNRTRSINKRSMKKLIGTSQELIVRNIPLPIYIPLPKLVDDW